LFLLLRKGSDRVLRLCRFLLFSLFKSVRTTQTFNAIDDSTVNDIPLALLGATHALQSIWVEVKEVWSSICQMVIMKKLQNSNL